MPRVVKQLSQELGQNIPLTSGKRERPHKGGHSDQVRTANTSLSEGSYYFSTIVFLMLRFLTSILGPNHYFDAPFLNQLGLAFFFFGKKGSSRSLTTITKKITPAPNS